VGVEVTTLGLLDDQLMGPTVPVMSTPLLL
jgi:hypothetical protein